MKRTTFAAAYGAHKANLPNSFWGHGQRVMPGNAVTRVYRGLYEATPEVQRRLLRSDRIFTIGSCFAGRIREELLARDFVLPGIDRGNPYGNYVIYVNPFAVLDAIRFGLGMKTWPQERCTVQTDHGWVDPLIEYVTLAFPSRQALVDFRRRHHEFLAHLPGCDVLVLTLGGSDAFFDLHTSTYVNQTPKSDPERDTRYEFREHTVAEVLAALMEIEAVLTAQRNGRPMNILVSVSPQPIEGTFVNPDVVVASVANKSILRAAVEEWRLASPQVQYLPLFEMVTFSEHAVWGSDLRHVSAEYFTKILRWFEKHYIETR